MVNTVPDEMPIKVVGYYIVNRSLISVIFEKMESVEGVRGRCLVCLGIFEFADPPVNVSQ